MGPEANYISDTSATSFAVSDRLRQPDVLGLSTQESMALRPCLTTGLPLSVAIVLRTLKNIAAITTWQTSNAVKHVQTVVVNRFLCRGVQPQLTLQRPETGSICASRRSGIWPRSGSPGSSGKILLTAPKWNSAFRANSITARVVSQNLPGCLR